MSWESLDVQDSENCSDRGLVFMCFVSHMVGVRLGLLGSPMAKIMSSRAA